MKWRWVHIIVLLLCCTTLLAQRQVGVRKRNRKIAKTETVAQRMDNYNERAHSHLMQGMSMSPQQYEDTIRALFRADRWSEAEPFLISAEREWKGRSTICCLMGRYKFHERDIAEARKYLLLALDDDESNTEALDLLAKLEEEEGNFATAIVHINDLLSFSPYDIDLWRKKIQLYRLLGNDAEADQLLERLAVIYPNDEQVRRDLIYRKEMMYIELSKRGDEKDSQEALEELISRNLQETHYYLDLSGSLLKEGKMERALEVCARGVQNTHGNRALISRRVSILCDMARYQEAEQYLDECIRMYGELGLTDLRNYVHQTAADAADADDVYTRHKRLYAQTDSEEALDWLISASMQRAWYDEAKYWLLGKERRTGKDAALLAKRYHVEKRLGNDRGAGRVLEEWYLENKQDEEVRELLAEKRLAEGTDLMHDELWEQALVPLQQADTLTMDPDLLAVVTRRIATCISMLPDLNKDSLDQMQHAIIYEKEHNLDSAYACLMRYRPSLDEFHEVQRHRYTLQSKLMKNSLSFEYQLARRAGVDAWNNNAHATYSRSFEHDAFDVTAGYAGRETAVWEEHLTETKDTTYFTEGGSGFEVGAAYYHFFEWGDISIGGSWASKFFPKGTAKLSITENLPLNWALTERLQWRYITDQTQYHIFSAGASAAWSSENGFILTPSVDAFWVQGGVYWNGGFKMTYLPLEGDRSSVFVSFGAGNAPDLSLMDSNMPLVFNMLNTSMSGGGFYLINGHLGVSASVDWYLMGDNRNMIRNYIYLHVGMSIFF